MEGALTDVTLLAFTDGVGEETLSEPDVGTPTLSEPATGDDPLSGPANGTPVTLLDACTPGPAESPPHEKSEMTQVIAKKILADGNAFRTGLALRRKNPV